MSMNRTCQPSRRRQSVSKSGLARTAVSAIAPVWGWFLIPAVILVMSEAPVWAQPKPPAKPVPDKAGGKTSTKKIEGAGKPQGDLEIFPDRLPPGYVPPPERLAIMDLDQPIASKEELEKLNKESVSKFFKVRTECDLSVPGKKIIVDTIRYKLAIMTVKDDPKRGAKEAPVPQVTKLPELHRRFVDDLQTIGGPAVKPADRAAFIEFVGKEVVKQIPDLLKNNYYVRLHAVMILGEIDYAGAFDLLLQVLRAKDIKDDPINGQPQEIKILAANGLIRIVRFANPPPPVKDRMTIAHAILDELTKTENHPWLQRRLIEVIRYCDITGVDPGDNNRPFVIEALIAIIKDKKREWSVRSKACYAIGRVPIPPSINLEDLITVIGEYSVELSAAAAANPNDPRWKSNFWDLYLAFKPNDTNKEKEMDAEKKLFAGLLARIKAVAMPLYNLVYPLVSDVLHGKVPNAAGRQALIEFVKGRKPVATPQPNGNGGGPGNTGPVGRD